MTSKYAIDRILNVVENWPVCTVPWEDVFADLLQEEGEKVYLVSWEGFSKEQDSFVPEAVVKKFPAALEEFARSQGDQVMVEDLDDAISAHTVGMVARGVCMWCT